MFRLAAHLKKHHFDFNHWLSDNDSNEVKSFGAETWSINMPFTQDGAGELVEKRIQARKHDVYPRRTRLMNPLILVNREFQCSLF